MQSIDYIGLDVHKKSVSYCAKTQAGEVVDAVVNISKMTIILFM